MSNQFLLYELKKILGSYTPRSKGNYAFYCPFCNHTKQKLEIKIDYTEDGYNPWECWVCKTRGKTIRSLLYSLGTKTNIRISTNDANSILTFIPNGGTINTIDDSILSLPKGFKPLYTLSKESILTRMAYEYLYSRGVTDCDIYKYNIGIASDPDYYDRIIIPSYDSNNELNYFIARSIHKRTYPKYKLPDVSKNVVIFENLINWNVPVTLVEGPFDVFSVKRNAIPLLGTTLLPHLKTKIVLSKVEDVYIALDPDAKPLALDIADELKFYDKRVFFIYGKDDPGQRGFKDINEQLRKSTELNLKELMKLKLNQ